MSKFFVSKANTDDCPCKGCQLRSAECHSSCKDYLAWSRDHRKKLDSLQKENESLDAYYQGAARRNKQLVQKGVSFGRGRKK